jgi:regulator of sigma E protease
MNGLIDFLVHYGIAVLFMLGVLIFIHEIGHLLTARLLGVSVGEFSIGFGKRIFGFKKNNIEYSVRVIPFGGYVKLTGGEIRTDSTPKPDEFLGKPLWVKILILISGSFMNVALAFFIFSCLALWTGVPDTRPIIGEAVKDKPAFLSGIKPADRITRINGKQIKTWQDMTTTVRNSQGRQMTLEVLRNDKMFIVQVTPVLEKIKDMFGREQEMFLIGVAPQIQHFNVIGSIREGFRQVGFWSTMMFEGLHRIITGEVRYWEAVGGPLLIADITARAARAGLFPFFFIMAIISLNLGIINMFPILGVTDGGHTIMYLFEGIIRRPLSQGAYGIITKFGLAFIIFLLLLITAADVWRFWGQRIFDIIK